MTTSNIEDLRAKFGDSFEVVLRMKDGKYKEFTKVLLSKASNSSNEQEIKKLCENANKLLKSTEKMSKSINSIKEFEIFNSVLGMMNLCATAAGFIIVCQKLNNISNQVRDVMNAVKEIHQEETINQFDKIIEDHTAMLDGKDGGMEFTEEKYRELIKEENTLLKSLYKIFCNETCSNRLEILEAIIALSAMMSVAICDFDTIYKYKHKEKKSLYTGHDAWLDTYASLLSSEFIKELQDFFFIEKDRTQYETDILVEGVEEKFKNAKEIITLRVELLNLLDSREEYDNAIKIINDSISNDISDLIQSEGYQNDEQVLALCKEAEQAVGLYS